MFEKIEINDIKWFNLELFPNELFKDVKGYENIYQVSNYGRIKSLKRKIKNKTYREKILKQEKSNDGYLRVDLYFDGKKKHKKVHRLVAEAFFNNYDKKYCINHKDENKQNNCIDNLELCTFSYNINYGTRNQRVAKKLSKKINQYDLNKNFIKTWDSMIQIERTLGIKISSIYKCCKKIIKKTKGYIFEYY